MSETIAVGKEAADTGPKHGHQSVTQTRRQLTIIGRDSFLKGVLIRAPGPDDFAGGNDGIVYVGGAKVTADRSEGTGGVPIPPGRSLTIPVCNPSELYVVTDSANAQDLAWIGV